MPTWHYLLPYFMTASSPPDMTLYWSETLAEDLLSFFSGRIKCQEAAADLTQETYLRFHHFIQSTPPNNARALAFSIAVNLATDYQRKMKVRQKIIVDGEFEPNMLPEAKVLASSGPERTVIARQQLQLVPLADFMQTWRIAVKTPKYPENQGHEKSPSAKQRKLALCDIIQIQIYFAIYKSC
jgi:Sigma-70 region 2